MRKVIIIVIVLILAGGVVFFLTKKSGPKSSVGPGFSEEKSEIITPKKTPVTPKQTPPADSEVLVKSQLKAQARSFIERYGSYSSDSDWENLKGLMGMMSEKLKAETEAKIASPLGSEGFYGLMSKVISIELKDFDSSGFAKFFALVQSQETKGSATNVLYKNTELTFVKEGGEWKVDGILFK